MAERPDLADAAKRRRVQPTPQQEEEILSKDISWCFQEGSAMSDFVRAFDWSATPLGAISSWPTPCKTALSIALSSHFPMVLWLGEDLRVIYNDAYLPQMGNKHPSALGKAGQIIWPEIWNVIGPMLDTVRKTSKPTWMQDQLLVMDRFGYPEETYWTYSYSPLKGPNSKVIGIFTAVEETTSRYIAERRLETLRSVSLLAAHASAPEDVSREFNMAIAPNPRDIPFALLYLSSDLAPAESARLVGRVRVVGGAPLLVDDFAGPVGQQVTQIPVPASLITEGDVTSPTTTALVVPLLANASGVNGSAVNTDTSGNALGVLIIGANPQKKADESYYTFAKLLSSSLCAALLTARDHQRERHKAEQLAELDRAKTAFFHNVSHELRTPLTLMLGPLEDVLFKPTEHPLGNQQRHALELALRNGRRLLSLVNVLLDFARIEAGRVRATFRPVDISALAIDLASNFRSACDKAGLQLIVDCLPLGEPIYLDKDMVEKVIINLLSNAFKFTMHGSIALSLKRVDNSAVLRVTDSGCGIPREELPRIFDRFHRVASAQGRTHEGTGIGLALVAELVKLHGGTVDVTSTVGVGSEFIVRIPFGRSHLPPDQVVNEPLDVRAPHTPFGSAMEWWMDSSSSSDNVSGDGSAARTKGTLGAKVLAVDDNADMLNYMSRILTEAGYGVTKARDGVEALTCVRESVQPDQQPFDLIVSDVMMPKLDGRGLLHAIRNSESPIKDIPVVFLSARAGEEEIGEGVTLGADDYLVKPFSARELVTRVNARIELTRFRLSAAKREQVLREQAERASQAKDHFIAVLSHELRTPLTPALMIAEAAEMDATLPDSVRADMRTIANNLKLEVQLISDLLDVTKIRQGKLALNQQPRVDIHQLVQQTLALLSESIRQHNHTINLSLVCEPAVVTGDATRLQQVLWNLIGNAIKFTPSDGVISISSEREENLIVVRVKDSGVGMDSASIPRLFSAFEQGGVSVTRQFGGLGLGLAIAKQLVLLHGGTIEAESAGLNKGSTFALRFPLNLLAPVAGTLHKTGSDDARRMFAQGAPTKLRILVVEDNASTQAVVGRMLQKLGQSTKIAGSVKEAIDVLQAEQFDAMLCDIGLPDGSGLQVMQMARELHPVIYAAALTGYGTDEDVQRTLSAGFAQHMVKPIRLLQLQEFVTAASSALVKSRETQHAS